jgi:hypothetical protein
MSVYRHTASFSLAWYLLRQFPVLEHFSIVPYKTEYGVRGRIHAHPIKLIVWWLAKHLNGGQTKDFACLVLLGSFPIA